MTHVDFHLRIFTYRKESELGSVLDQKRNDWRIEVRWLGSFRKGELVSQNWHHLCLSGNDMSIKNGRMSD